MCTHSFPLASQGNRYRKRVRVIQEIMVVSDVTYPGFSFWLRELNLDHVCPLLSYRRSRSIVPDTQVHSRWVLKQVQDDVIPMPVELKY